MDTAAHVTTANSGNLNNSQYEEFVKKLSLRLVDRTAKGPLFRANVEGIFDIYLNALPPENRQYHTCSACRYFLERFGALVVIDEDGVHHSAIWDEDDAPDYYKPVARALAQAAVEAEIAGVFVSSRTVWGFPETGPWRHLSVTPPVKAIYTGLVHNAGQTMAARAEDYKTLSRDLATYDAKTLDLALAVLDTDALYRSEKIAGPVRWLRQLQDKKQRRKSHIWRAVANGYARSSMAQMLMDDLASGMEFDAVKQRFDAAMHPLRYQRPSEPPKAGNIAVAEKIVAAMGLEPSLARRFARLDEVPTIWKPRAPRSDQGGVFGHLVPRDAQPERPITAPRTKITWEKFARTVLPNAESITYQVPAGSGPYATMLTAVNPDAPPLLAWDLPDARNPFSHYTYSSGSLPSQWGLVPGSKRNIVGIANASWLWHDPERFASRGQMVFLFVDGARDSRDTCLGLFPECLRPELREIRSTIEAFSNKGKLADVEGPVAAGVMLHKSMWSISLVLTVTTGPVVAEYEIDRWD